MALRRILRRVFGRPSPPLDFVGYEVLIDFIHEKSLHRLDGDLVEIGAFMGGGTAKLARFAASYGKRVFAIDIFNPAADTTASVNGTSMSDIYLTYLEGRSQRDAYRRAIRGLDNVVTIDQDSATVSFPPEQRFVFGFIDGNHQPGYVQNDFDLVWPNLVAGGVLGFHDYNWELPEVTTCIDSIVAGHAAEIAETRQIAERHILLLVKDSDMS